ncbi:sigma-70 family RNA polymerase sigma factor [Nonomuraea sp. FMUSA5-5]|uniref:RNA polymerase sigma factor n=1 Tax=Nonomuraea composti TaxID=2720023 RepID=A0ABX1B0N9_9ACTN|nr:sigma-70 family RNA polymerase sigma factor [Nonomuraea sp. FMUSA5-5]NJP88716.1 sigma-70 family RNA polymerase sigma factor [Nonomuraea sp. FMUSA5-5]
MSEADQVSAYLARIGRTPLLTAAEEVALAERMDAGARAFRLLRQGAAEPALEDVVADGRAARRHLIEANLRLVVSVAKRYAHRGMSLADVIQDGNLGLIEAVERFDHARGNRFSTVATWWIRKAIQRGLEHARTVRLPIAVQDELAAVGRAEARALHRLGRAPTEQELAEEAGQAPARLAYLRRLPGSCVGLDVLAGEEHHRYTLGDLLADDGGQAVERLVEQRELKKVLGHLVEGLAPRQALVVRMRFGMDGHERHTYRQIAEQLGLTPQWVRRLEQESLTRLRGQGRSHGLRAWAS